MGVVAPRSWKESSWASNQAWSSFEEAKRMEGVAEVEPDEDRCRCFIPHHWSAKRLSEQKTLGLRPKNDFFWLRPHRTWRKFKINGGWQKYVWLRSCPHPARHP